MWSRLTPTGTFGFVTSVVVRGVRGALGRCVAARVAALTDVDVTIDDASGEPCHALVEIGLADHDVLGRRGASPTLDAAELIVEADRRGAEHLVVVTSAMVYGAIANNPVPLTEDAVLRPDPKFAYARQLAAAEELVESWRTARPGRTVAVLRPAIPVAAGGTSSLARALTAGFGQRFGEADPGAQFVHHADVASAVALAVVKRLDGVYNVAPDGSIPGERVRALSGQRWRIPLPDRLSEVVGALRWRFQRGPIPPGLRSYTRQPWSIANDKLKAEGWEPTVTGEQAYVESTEARWWVNITPKRRQELALGTFVAAVLGVLATGTALAVRWWRRRQP
jgi:nucleoside-diphosphate-sugar epimerase